MNKELYDYIQESRKKNVPDKAILDILVSKGWDFKEVTEAMAAEKHKTLPLKRKKIIISVGAATGVVIALLIIFNLFNGNIYALFTGKDAAQQMPYVETPSLILEASKECAKDMSCFISAAATCLNASVSFKKISEHDGVVTIDTKYYEIKNVTGEKCILKITLLEQEPLSLLAGKSGQCSFPSNNYLAETLRKISNGQFSGEAICALSPQNEWICTTQGDLEQAECFGELFLNYETGQSESQACTTDNDCRQGLYCISGKCASLSGGAGGGGGGGSAGGGGGGGSAGGGSGGGSSPSQTIELQLSQPDLVVRNFSSSEISPLQTITVTLTKIVNENQSGLLIEEIFPEGWNVSDPGTGFLIGNSLKWFELNNLQYGNLTYEITAPASSGTGQWGGEYIIDGGLPVDISGETTVIVAES